MDCNRIKEHIYPFLDDQLDADTSELVKGHLSTCPICDLELKEEKKLDSLVRNSIIRENAPYELKERILERIREFQDNPKYVFILPLPRSVARLALGVLFIGLFIIPVLININKPFPVFGESIKDHIQFLQGNLSLDITSDKPEEIHSWLQARLDFKVKVPDLSGQGVYLLGARMCAFKDKKVAYIRYGRGAHKLSVFMFDAEGMKFPRTKRIVVNNKLFHLSKEKGCNSVLWMDEGIACIFVSDLDEAQLIHLASI